MARRLGVRVEIADLGDWGKSALNAEYDPRGPTIRVNERRLREIPRERRREFFARAVGHELFHHLEATGAIARPRDRMARESAADAFAQTLVPGGPRGKVRVGARSAVDAAQRRKRSGAPGGAQGAPPSN